MTTIVSVKWGDKYSSEDVNVLFRSIRAHSPDIKFVCYTDSAQGLESWIQEVMIPDKRNVDTFWNKASVFDSSIREFQDTKMILLDIDMELLRSPNDLLLDFQPVPGHLHMVNAYWKNNKLFQNETAKLTDYWDMPMNSSCVVWSPSDSLAEIARDFFKDPEYNMLAYTGFDRWLYYNHLDKISSLPLIWFYSHRYGGEEHKLNIFRMFNGTR